MDSQARTGCTRRTVLRGAGARGQAHHRIPLRAEPDVARAAHGFARHGRALAARPNRAAVTAFCANFGLNTSRQSPHGTSLHLSVRAQKNLRSRKSPLSLNPASSLLPIGPSWSFPPSGPVPVA